ncbi:helix-turn-helix domain-containing protein [Chelativorans salis]|uniref:MarR family transcriptional regulator n=1 Tax=Chelativorans salis TaxID=2978478 RepID=A0ABT2LIL0_9HYPH|nr:helix-turn-helix domain-containing protein [Chelativorans sp. EGI FJ00035]MCT7374410.1 MarR family transcriptional regulator [Chelativorans sp. EGI FJ00035]
MDNGEVYLRAMMSLVARQTFTPERLAEVVAPQSNLKSLEAFNLCDGTNTQKEIATKLGIDAGQFSRMIKRWIEEGILIRVTQEGNVKPVHVYPIPDRLLQNARKKGSD